MAENRKLVKLRAFTEGLSMEERGKRLHDSFRRFILREEKEVEG